MKRRDFISLAALSAAGMGIIGGCDKLNRRDLVSTPQKRMAYLRRMLKRLCTDLGPHSVFSPAYNRAAAIVKAEMEKALPEVVISECTFKGWRLLSESQFTLGERPIEAFPLFGSPGTPDGGVQGLIKKVGHENPALGYYTIVDPKTDTMAAYVLVRKNGPAIPYPMYLSPPEAHLEEGNATFEKQGRWPALCVGVADSILLDEAAEKHIPVRWNVKADFVTGMKANSVIGTLPGETRDEEIVFLAHLDTVYNSPGANDNTASVIVMLMLAHAVSGLKPGKTVSFFATAGEEYGKLGATHYINQRKKAGTLDRIKTVIEFDSLTWGNNFRLNSKNTGLLKIAEAANKSAGIDGVPELFERDTACDGKAFIREGIPVLYVNTKGEKYAYTSNFYHSSKDTAENVAVELVENGFLTFREVIRVLADV